MGLNMGNKVSLLKLNKINITDKISIKIPTVGEILTDEQEYYSMISSLTATPFQYMVQLDDLHIDFTTISDFDLFKMLFPIYAKTDLSLLFGDLDLSDMKVSFYKNRPSETFLYSAKNEIIIDELIYNDLMYFIRKINAFKRNSFKPGNEHMKSYLLEKERKKQKRNAKKTYEPYLENLVIALVNTCEFPYNYQECMDLSIYLFNQSYQQINRKISFDNAMMGVYAGTIDVSKLSNKDILTWIPIQKD